MATKTVKRTATKKAPAKTGVRRVALVGVNPGRKTASIKKVNFTRFVVLMNNNDDGWMEYAAFKYETHAAEYAQWLFDSRRGTATVKVVDSQS